jgi:hypothetical protein
VEALYWGITNRPGSFWRLPKLQNGFKVLRLLTAGYLLVKIQNPFVEENIPLNENKK